MSLTLTGIRGVVFDLDDTLYPECDYALSGFRAVGAWLKTQLACPVDPATRLIEMFEEGKRYTLFDDLMAEWQCPRAAELIPGMVACYRGHLPEIRLHADAERAIDRWRCSFRLGLITDGPLLSQKRKIEALTLRNRLDLIICTDEWGQAFWKPHLRAFQEFEQVWSLSGRELVYIADNPSKDFVAPNKLGWHSVQVLRPGGQYTGIQPADSGRPAGTVSTMDELELSS